MFVHLLHLNPQTEAKKAYEAQSALIKAAECFGMGDIQETINNTIFDPKAFCFAL
jgi:hypothetical protein